MYMTSKHDLISFQHQAERQTQYAVSVASVVVMCDVAQEEEGKSESVLPIFEILRGHRAPGSHKQLTADLSLCVLHRRVE